MTRAGMQIRPIRTQQAHRAAIARIEQLIGAAPNSQESEEFDVLVTLVDAYEAKHLPIDAPDPIAAIRFRMSSRVSAKNLIPEPLLTPSASKEWAAASAHGGAAGRKVTRALVSPFQASQRHRH